MTTETQRALRFELHHRVDAAHGGGEPVTVADGVLWPDGTVSVRWRGARPSTVFWDSIKDAHGVHSHDGKTQFVWLDDRDQNLQRELADARDDIGTLLAEIAELRDQQTLIDTDRTVLGAALDEIREHAEAPDRTQAIARILAVVQRIRDEENSWGRQR